MPPLPNSSLTEINGHTSQHIDADENNVVKRELNQYDKSTQDLEKGEKAEVSAEDVEKAPLFPSCRITIAIMGLLATFCMATLNNTMGVALVCMTSNSSSSSQQSNSTSYAEPEFDWSNELQGWVLSSFFIGETIVRIPSGILTRRFGARRVYLLAMTGTTVLTFLLPTLARAHVGLLMAGQVTKGLCSGFTTATFFALFGVWSPAVERGLIVSIFMIGRPAGTIIGSISAGYLCQSSFAGGWPGIFYTFAIISSAWIVLWFFTGYSSPEDHPRISQKELKYIQQSVPSSDTIKEMSVPWRRILTTPGIWAVFAATVSFGWCWYMSLTSLPQYLTDVLQLDIKENGVVNALPYIANAVISTPVSLLVALVVRKNWLRLKYARKLAETMSLVPAGIIALIIGYVTGDQIGLAIALLTMWVGLLAFSNSGHWAIVVDMSPNFVGVIKGVDATLNTIPGIIAPVVVGALTPNRTAEEWRVVFFISAGIAFVGWLMFVLFSTSDEQPWNNPEDSNDNNNTNTDNVIETEKKEQEKGFRLRNNKVGPQEVTTP